MLHSGNYTALFSASEQTHCALVICNCEWGAVALHSTVRVSTEMMYLQHCLVVTWLLPHETAAISTHVLCFVTLVETTYVGCVCV